MTGRRDSRQRRQYRELVRGGTRRLSQDIDSTDAQLRAFWLKNWPLLTGVLAVGFIAARLLGASADDPETAYAILQIQGTVNVVAGSLISGLGLLIAPLAAVSVYAYKIGHDPYKASLGWLVGIFGIIIFADTAPFGIFVLMVALTACLSAILWGTRRVFSKITLRKNGRKRRVNLSIYEIVGMYLGLTLLSFTQSSFPLWLPAENIVVKESTLTAYVLSQDPVTTYIMTENPVRIIRLSTSGITSQSYCRTPGYIIADEPLVQLLRLYGVLKPGNAAIYPRCRDIYLP